MQDENSDKLIMVLEDDPMVARIIGKATGLMTQNALTVEELESTIKASEPMAMFIDVHIGMNINGIEVIPRLKNKMPFCPIIVVAGDHSPDLVGDALAAGGANSSWNASVNLANAAPVKAGTKSIAVTVSAAWGATPTCVSAGSVTKLPPPRTAFIAPASIPAPAIWPSSSGVKGKGRHFATQVSRGWFPGSRAA